MSTPIETILAQCGGSQNELARRLTLETKAYYSTSMVAHWVRVGKVPAEHVFVVALVTGLEPRIVAPWLFGGETYETKTVLGAATDAKTK